MGHKKYLIISGIIFCAISLLHLARAVFGVQFLVGEWDVPLWISYLIFVAAGSMSIYAYRLANK